jgi:hypothetical protein
LDYEGPTGCQLLNLLLIRFEEERVNMKKAAITAVQVSVVFRKSTKTIKNHICLKTCLRKQIYSIPKMVHKIRRCSCNCVTLGW